MLVTTRAAGPRSFCTSSGGLGLVGVGGGPLGDLRVRARSPAGRSRSGDVTGGRLDERRGLGGRRARRGAARGRRRRSAAGAACAPRGAAAGVGVPFAAGAAAAAPAAAGRRRGRAVAWRPRRACSPRRSPTTPGRPSSCPSGTARTARPRATRWHRKRHASSQDPPSGSRWDRPLPLRFVTAPLLVRLLLLLMTTLRPAGAPARLRTAVRDGSATVFTWSAHAGQRGATCQFGAPQGEVVGDPCEVMVVLVPPARRRAQVMSRRNVVTRPIAASPTPYASSTRAPCHHSSSDPTPVSE